MGALGHIATTTHVVVLACVAVVLLGPLLPTTQAAPAKYKSFCDPEPGWKTVFADDFDGDKLNTSAWNISVGYIAGQGRTAWLTPKNVYLDKGNLVLRSQQNDLGYNYTTGAVTTQGRHAFKYGRCCVRARLPGVNGSSQGVWPAHWMLPDDNSCHLDHGEIDIMEMIDGNGHLWGTYHWNRNYPKQNCTDLNGRESVTGSVVVDHWDSDYHEYAVEWADDHVTFAFDGEVYNNVTPASKGSPGDVPPQFPNWPMYVILNTAIGGGWPGPPNNDTIFPIYHYVDYVRVAQKTED